MNYNHAVIVGRVTAAPQLRSTPGGQSVTSFGVATNQKWTDKDGKPQEAVEFHNVVAWGRKAELAASFLSKGSLVFVEGRLSTRSWTDKDGQTRRTTEIIADNLQFGPAAQQQKSKSEPVELAPEETLPADGEPAMERLFPEEEGSAEVPF